MVKSALFTHHLLNLVHGLLCFFKLSPHMLQLKRLLRQYHAFNHGFIFAVVLSQAQTDIILALGQGQATAGTSRRLRTIDRLKRFDE